MSSALWVMWGLLCGHLVAFKAPKSWPNKFLINVWGGFSVIFIASYTANIAALIAGLFFHNASNRRSGELLEQRIGAPTASAAESFMKEYHHHMWEHMKKFHLKNIEEGIMGLKNGTLDLLLGDTAILDYYRATDDKCSLQKIGEPYIEDAYGIGMKKGFPLKDSISALISKYSSNGYLDILIEKWYGGLPCYQLDNDIVMPRPLGVEAVAGVFLLLGLGVILGILILIFEHLFFKYSLPILRLKPKGSIWRSRNIMFFSQKLYRFINCVELVSPHHAARELVHTLRQGQIASLFQKSIKRKEDEQRRRRRSKAQFFEMIQEIRRVQQAEKMKPTLEVVAEDIETTETSLKSEILETFKPSLSLKISQNSRQSFSPKQRLSPIHKLFRNNNTFLSRSNSSSLCPRRFSTDSILSERLDTIGRRLSRDLKNSPPDFVKRYEVLPIKGKARNISTFCGDSKGNLKRYETISTKNKMDGKKISATIPHKKYQTRRTPLNANIFTSTTLYFTKTQPNIIDRDLRNNSDTSSKGFFSKTICELPVDLLQASNNSNNQNMHRSKGNIILQSSANNDYCTESFNETQHFLQQRYLIDKRPMHQSSSSQTTPTPFRNNRIKKRSIQNLHHRQKSLDELNSRPPMPLPKENTLLTRPHSSHTIDYNDEYDKIEKKKILLKASSTDMYISHKEDSIKNSLNYNEFENISFDRLRRQDLFKLNESSETDMHKYLNKSNQIDYPNKSS